VIKQLRADLAAFAVAAVVVICAMVLLLAGNAVPSWFEWVAIAAITGGAGLALPGVPGAGATGLLAAGVAELRQYLAAHTHVAPTGAAPQVSGVTSPPVQAPPPVP